MATTVTQQLHPKAEQGRAAQSDKGHDPAGFPDLPSSQPLLPCRVLPGRSGSPAGSWPSSDWVAPPYTRTRGLGTSFPRLLVMLHYLCL